MTTTALAEITPNQHNPAVDDLARYYPKIVQLTPKRQCILYALLENMVSKEGKSDSQIADELEIDRGTIREARLNPLFAELFGVITLDVVRGNIDKPISNLFRLGEKDTRANEILLRIPGIYQPTQRILSQNLNISAKTQYANPDDMIQAFFERIRAQGYTKERIVALWDSL